MKSLTNTQGFSLGPIALEWRKNNQVSPLQNLLTMQVLVDKTPYSVLNYETCPTVRGTSKNVCRNIDWCVRIEINRVCHI